MVARCSQASSGDKKAEIIPVEHDFDHLPRFNRNLSLRAAKEEFFNRSTPFVRCLTEQSPTVTSALYPLYVSPPKGKVAGASGTAFLL